MYIIIFKKTINKYYLGVEISFSIYIENFINELFTFKY